VGFAGGMCKALDMGDLRSQPAWVPAQAATPFIVEEQDRQRASASLRSLRAFRALYFKQWGGPQLLPARMVADASFDQGADQPAKRVGAVELLPHNMEVPMERN
jgi:hypothetical protein